MQPGFHIPDGEQAWAIHVKGGGLFPLWERCYGCRTVLTLIKWFDNFGRQVEGRESYIFAPAHTKPPRTKQPGYMDVWRLFVVALWTRLGKLCRKSMSNQTLLNELVQAKRFTKSVFPGRGSQKRFIQNNRHEKGHGRARGLNPGAKNHQRWKVMSNKSPKKNKNPWPESLAIHLVHKRILFHIRAALFKPPRDKLKLPAPSWGRVECKSISQFHPQYRTPRKTSKTASGGKINMQGFHFFPMSMSAHGREPPMNSSQRKSRVSPPPLPKRPFHVWFFGGMGGRGRGNNEKSLFFSWSAFRGSFAAGGSEYLWRFHAT